MATIASLIVSLRANTGPFSASMAKSRQEFGGFVANVEGGVARISSVVGGLAALAGAGGLLAGLGTGVKLAADMEQAAVSFEVMIGNAERAQTLLRSLDSFAATTPFELPGIVDATRKLIAFGVADTQAVGTLRRIGDVAAGVGVPLSELAEIYGKAKVQGRLMAEDINQLTGRGIPIIQEFARQFGVAEGEVKGLVTSGAIGFAQLERAFVDLTSSGGRFFGMTDRQSRTLSGLWSTFTDTVRGSLRNVANEAIRTFDIKGIVGSAAGTIERYASRIVPLVSASAQWASENRELITTLAGVAGSVVALSIGGKILGTLTSQTIGWASAIVDAGGKLGWVYAMMKKAPAMPTAAAGAAGGTNVAGFAMTAATAASLAVGAKNVGMFQKLRYEASTFVGTMRGAGIGAAIADLGLLGGAGALAAKGLGLAKGAVAAVFSLPGAAIAAVAAAGVMLFGTFKRMGTEGETFGRAWGETGASWLRTFGLIDGQAKRTADRLADLGRQSIAAKDAAARAMSATSFGDASKAWIDNLKAQYAQLAELQQGGDAGAVAGRAREISATLARLGDVNASGFDFTVAIQNVEELRKAVGDKVPEIERLLAGLRGDQAGLNFYRNMAGQLGVDSTLARLKEVSEFKAKLEQDRKDLGLQTIDQQFAALAHTVGQFTPEIRAAGEALARFKAAQLDGDLQKLNQSLREQVELFGLDAAAQEVARLRARGATAAQLAQAEGFGAMLRALERSRTLATAALPTNAAAMMTEYATRLAKLRAELQGNPTGLKRAIGDLNKNLNESMAGRAKELIESLVTPAQKLKREVEEIQELWRQGLLSGEQMSALIARQQQGLANDVASKLQQGAGEAIVVGSTADVQATYRAEQRNVAERYAKEAVEVAKRQEKALNRIEQGIARTGPAGLSIVQLNI